MKSGAFIGWMMGFEPTTSGTTIRRSNQLNYNHHFVCGCKYKYFILFTTQNKIIFERYF